MPKPGSHIGCSTTPLLIVSRLVGIFSVSARVPYSSKMRRFDFLLIRSGEVKSSRFFVCIVIDYWLVNIIRSGCSANERGVIIHFREQSFAICPGVHNGQAIGRQLFFF